MKKPEAWPAYAVLVSAMAAALFRFGLVETYSLELESARPDLLYGSDGIVGKTAFSTNRRLVFVVGLEGTGHHFFTVAFSGLAQKHPELRLNETLTPTTDSSVFYLPLIMKGNVANYVHSLDQGRKEMMRVAQLAEQEGLPTFQLFPGFSYPMGNGVQKVMQYTDARLAAEMAEAMGVDFRILYLKRPAREFLLANTVHRRFQE